VRLRLELDDFTAGGLRVGARVSASGRGKVSHGVGKGGLVGIHTRFKSMMHYRLLLLHGQVAALSLGLEYPYGLVSTLLAIRRSLLLLEL